MCQIHLVCGTNCCELCLTCDAVLSVVGVLIIFDFFVYCQIQANLATFWRTLAVIYWYINKGIVVVLTLTL